MIRTVISLSEEDKAWLDRRAREERVPMTQLVRRAVRLLRRSTARDAEPLEEILGRTSGIWKRGDGLDYQRRLRDEW